MRTILLAGGPVDQEPGFPTALPRPFWPMIMRPLVPQLIDRLVAGGTRALSVCANGRATFYSARLNAEALKLAEIHFVQDVLPRGPAGCLKDNEPFVQDDTFAVVHAACWLEDPMADLVARHRQQHNQLTVFCAPGTYVPRGVYVCEPEVLRHIPPVGYCDIKEQLIPCLVDHGLRVGALPLRGRTAEVINTRSYLDLHRELLRESLEPQVRNCPGVYHPLAPDVWVSSSAQLGRDVRLFGPLIVGPDAKMEDGAVIIGPGSVGPGAEIGRDAVVTECAVWANARVPRGICVDRMIVIPESVADREPAGFIGRLRRRGLRQWSDCHVRNQ